MRLAPLVGVLIAPGRRRSEDSGIGRTGLPAPANPPRNAPRTSPGDPPASGPEIHAELAPRGPCEKSLHVRTAATPTGELHAADGSTGTCLNPIVLVASDFAGLSATNPRDNLWFSTPSPKIQSSIPRKEAVCLRITCACTWVGR